MIYSDVVKLKDEILKNYKNDNLSNKVIMYVSWEFLSAIIKTPYCTTLNVNGIKLEVDFNRISMEYGLTKKLDLVYKFKDFFE